MATQTNPIVHPIPHYIVTELLGQVQFHRNEEQDVDAAESIASYEHNSMQSLKSMIQGIISVDKYRREFINTWKTLPENTYFAPYFISHP